MNQRLLEFEVIERTLALLNYHSQMKHVDVSIHGIEQRLHIDPHDYAGIY